MENSASAMCRVIIHDSNPSHAARIKEFCDKHNLVAVKSQSDNIMEILRSNVDLGAIFLDEEPGGNLELCHSIHRTRPELPIILRQADAASQAARLENPPFCTSYCIEQIEGIRSTINERIFNKHYPNALVRGIEEITQESLRHLFPNVSIDTFLPYLVKDRIIYGELFSLIPVESAWCRGYMMMQTDEKNIVDIVKPELLGQNPRSDFRLINDVLSEVTNMIWGGIRSRFVAQNDDGVVHAATQVPIIVNHHNRYITFGTDTPQLCFRYTLTHGKEGRQITLYQKFVFNLNWAPERFSENQPTVDDLIDSGELELF